jgi:hypothetical protein
MSSPPGSPKGAAGLAGVANKRGDGLAAREHAADDLAADAAGGADHRGGDRVSSRYGSVSSTVNRTGSPRACSAAVNPPPADTLLSSQPAALC